MITNRLGILAVRGFIVLWALARVSSRLGATNNGGE
jgi:hypothetical protein